MMDVPSASSTASCSSGSVFERLASERIEPWTSSTLRAQRLSLANCRADTQVLWQSRGDAPSYHGALRRAYALVRARDRRHGFLARQPPEDGRNGAETCHLQTPTSDVQMAISNESMSHQQIPSHQQNPSVQIGRDLIDSVNELCFLEERLAITKWPPGEFCFLLASSLSPPSAFPSFTLCMPLLDLGTSNRLSTKLDVSITRFLLCLTLPLCYNLTQGAPSSTLALGMADSRTVPRWRFRIST